MRNHGYYLDFMVGAQSSVGLPQHRMIAKYDLKGYAYQAAPPD